MTDEIQREISKLHGLIEYFRRTVDRGSSLAAAYHSIIDNVEAVGRVSQQLSLSSKQDSDVLLELHKRLTRVAAGVLSAASLRKPEADSGSTTQGGNPAA
jgi:DICT domain-containing protein